MKTAVVTAKGQIVIPSRIRKKLNLKKGTRLYIEAREEEIVIKPITPEYFRKIAGILDSRGKLSKAILEERKKDKAREA